MTNQKIKTKYGNNNSFLILLINKPQKAYIPNKATLIKEKYPPKKAGINDIATIL